MAALSLAEAAQGLQVAFAGVPRPERVAGCPHCVTSADEQSLLSQPLRNLPAAALGRYAVKAMSTWGTEADFRYFAPRLLDLTVSGAMSWPGFEIVCRKLAMAGLASWPEQPAVEEFLRAVWSDTLRQFPSQLMITDVMRGAALITSDAGPYLAEWEQLATIAMTRQLREAAESELSAPWTPASPGEATGSAGQFSRWLTDGAAAGAVLVRAMQTSDREFLGELTHAHDALTFLAIRVPPSR